MVARRSPQSRSSSLAARSSSVTGGVRVDAQQDAGRTDPRERSQLSFPVDTTVHAVAKLVAAHEGKSLTALLEEWVTERARKELHKAKTALFDQSEQLRQTEVQIRELEATGESSP